MNADLGDQVSLIRGPWRYCKPGEFGYDINEIAINPLPPVAATGEVLLPPSAVLRVASPAPGPGGSGSSQTPS